MLDGVRARVPAWAPTGVCARACCPRVRFFNAAEVRARNQCGLWVSSFVFVTLL